jgi:DNA-binding NtrC family response regulator
MNGKTVLVVDDDASLRLLCRVNLELDGHQVLEASSLTQARELIATVIPDVVLLDVHLGSESGLDLIDDIDSLELPTQVVLLSGSSQISPELRARVSAVLGKPFDLAELTTAIASVQVGR